MSSTILVLHVTFDMTIGGAQQVIRHLVEQPANDKINSEIVCLDNQLGDIGQLLIDQGVKVFLLDRNAGFDFKVVSELRRMITQKKYDIIHCHQYTPFIYGLAASIFTGTRVVFTEHGRFYPDYGTWKRKLMNPFFARFTSKITAISEATRNALVEYENFRYADIEVVYNGISDQSNTNINIAEEKIKLGLKKDSFVFGTISRLQPIKNQKMMVNAFSELARKYANCYLIIVGDGEMRQSLEDQVAELMLSERVRFTGFQIDPFKYHSIIDVFLLTSFSEGTSMTLLEAMSFSTPCVVTDVGGNPELIINNYNGFVVPSDQLTEFTKACEFLLNDSQKRDQLGKNARKIYENKFRLSNMQQEYLEIYQNIAQ